jgi:hypothetical protein
MILFLERKKRLFRKTIYNFKQYNNNINNYVDINIDNVIKNKKIYRLFIEDGEIVIFKENKHIIINVYKYKNYFQYNKSCLRYKFNIDKLGYCGFLKSNKNTIIMYHTLPFIKIGKINPNLFKIIINKFNFSNINKNIYNNYILITIIITLLLFD